MQKTIRDVLDRKGWFVHSVRPGATVLEAVRMMNEQCVGCVLVTEDDEPVGIVTERDILVRVVDALRDPRTTLVSEVMSLDLVTIGPETSVVAGMKVMTEQRLRHLPVVQGRIIDGLVSQGDLTKAVTDHLQKEVDHLQTYIMGPVLNPV